MYFRNSMNFNDGFNKSYIGSNPFSYNSNNQNILKTEASNYSTTTFRAPRPQYYNQYLFEENKNEVITNLKYSPKTNSYNINSINSGNQQNNYSIYNTNKYSTKTFNPVPISNNNSYTASNSQNKQNIQNSYKNEFNNYSTSESSLEDGRNNYQSILNNDEICGANNLVIFSKHEETINDPLLSTNGQIDDNPRNNPQLVNSARFSKSTLELLNSLGNNQNSNINKPNINNNIRLSLPLKTNSENNTNFFEDKKQNNQNINLRSQEIISDNDSQEYYRETINGLVQNYAYVEDSNKENRDYMEDQGQCIENLNGDPNKILFCIFDGHGGGQVSKYLQQYFAVFMKKMFLFKEHFKDFQRLFKLLDEKIKLLNVPDVGSTATIVYIEKQPSGKRILYCANVGDSRCVLVNRKGIMRMTHDDRVDDPKENERVINQGGIIVNNRIYGRLMLSRSFGDWEIKQYGLIVEPHLVKIEINEDDLYLIVASDGVWDVIEDEECKGFTEIYANSLDICKYLVQECLNRGSLDNISCFVISL